ncbi:EAL and HDOD domain-containing protein [Cellulomonas soli]
MREICVGRQAIHDLLGRVVGHELLFRPSRTAQTSGVGIGPGTEGVRVTGDDEATASVIVATTTEFGTRDLAGDGLLFINLPRSFIVDELPVPLDPRRVVLEVLERVAPDEEVMAGLDRLHRRGFALALDDYAPGDHREVMLPLCEYVKIDLGDVTVEELPDLVAHVRRLAPRARLVAERVETADDFTMAADVGFDLYQGYHLRRPVVLSRPALVHHALVASRLLVRLGDPQVSYRVLARLTAADPAITLKVFRVVNSVAGAGQRVRNLHQALVLLGRYRFRSMLVLEVMAIAGHRDDEVALRSLARASAAEILVPHDPLAASTETLVRMVAELLDMSVDELGATIHRTRPTHDVEEACDVLDAYLAAVEFDTEPEAELSREMFAVSMAYLAGVREARELLSGVLGPLPLD